MPSKRWVSGVIKITTDPIIENVAGKVTLSEVKADTDVADAISKKHANTNDPTADQKAALGGTSGTPSVSNKFVTNADSRNTDTRDPKTHSHAESDVISLVTDLSSKEPANSNIQTHVISAHAPSNAQKNSDITKAEIEAKLIGEISSHTHAGGGATNFGQATIPFASWLTEDKISVTGQASILATSKILASIYADNEDVYAQDWRPPIIRNVVAGAGFDVTLRPEIGTFKGNVKINWTWA